ncbi:hypothetical protein F5Y04DRAFT_282030 [Hypomontagnella monticulosa]|nr:hypothetical protein F5Y04DRAFT_282030 [Hypomontagnella monticulosa]
MPFRAVHYDGFEFSFGRFFAYPGRVEYVESATLRKLFLPGVTQEAKELVRNNPYFVRGQLRHYGVSYDESELTGDGIDVFKAMLEEGELDVVPEDIQILRNQLSTLWYDQLTLEELGDSYPERLIRKCFLNVFGEPDPAKITDVLTVPLLPGSTYRVGKLIDAVHQVDGLHCERREDSLYIGWDPAAVGDAVQGLVEGGEWEKQKEKADMEDEIMTKHSKYALMARLTNDPATWSPVGSYAVTCGVIQDNSRGECGERIHMTLNIHEPDEYGYFWANLDFGVVEGVMILGSHQSDLDEYCAAVERAEMAIDADDVETQRELDEAPQRKKTTSDLSNSNTLFFRWRGMETAEGDLLTNDESGIITFQDPEFTTFTGEMDISIVGDDVIFFARKVSGVAESRHASWLDYTEHTQMEQHRW